MRKNTFQPSFQFHNNEKPKKSIGDISIESDSYNDSIDEKNNNINDNSYDFPKENTISSLSISNSIHDEKPTISSINNQNNDKNKDLNNSLEKIYDRKIDDFNIMKRSTYSKENDRYNNISEIYNNNLLFLSICESDYHEEDDDIVNFVNSEINSQNNNDNEENKDYIKGFKANYKLKSDNNIEVLLEPNLLKIYSSDEIGDFKNENNTYDEKKTNVLENNNSIKENNKNVEQKNEKQNKNKVIEKNNINNNENNNNIINNIDNNNSYKKHYEDLRDSKKFFEKNKAINKNKASAILSITKQNKIFQKFLIVSVDTSGLYSLDDEMEILILNPKITYNYPFNKKERELD